MASGGYYGIFAAFVKHAFTREFSSTNPAAEKIGILSSHSASEVAGGRV